MISIQVPTEPYLRKFLLSRAGSNDGRIILSNTNSYGIVLWKILTRKPYRVDNRLTNQYSSHITFMLSEDFYNRSGFCLSDTNIHIFNRFLKTSFEESLFDYLTINLTQIGGERPKIETLILRYCSFYNITDKEKSLDALLKSYQRWRADRKYILIRV